MLGTCGDKANEIEKLVAIFVIHDLICKCFSLLVLHTGFSSQGRAILRAFPRRCGPGKHAT